MRGCVESSADPLPGSLALRRRRVLLVSTLAVEQANQCLGVPERVVDRMMIVLRSAETLPVLRLVKIANQPSVDVGDSSSGMPERVHAEVAPEVEVDPLEVVRRIVRYEHDRAPRFEPLTKLRERILRTVCPVERLRATFA